MEGAKGLYSAVNTISRGAWSTSIAMGMEWNQPNVDAIESALDSAGMSRIEASGKLGFVARAMSEAVPNLAYNMTVGKYGIFVTEYGNSYQDAINNGASNAKANVVAMPVATINTMIESLQIDQIFTFASGGKGAKQAVKKMIKDRAYKAFLKNGAKFTGNSIKTAINEGIEGALQEGVSIAIPGYILGVYPKNEDGTIDWMQVGEQMGQSFVGEGLGGLAIGIGGGMYNARNKHNYKLALTGQLMTQEGMTENEALKTATGILERLVAQDGTPKEIYREELGKVKMADRRHKASAHIVQKAKGIPDEQYRQIAEDLTGKRSIKDMNYEEAERFIDELRKTEAVEPEPTEDVTEDVTEEQTHDEILKEVQEIRDEPEVVEELITEEPIAQPKAEAVEDVIDEPVEIGERHTVGNVNSEVYDTERMDGVDYEVYIAIDDGDDRGVVRVKDADSGETVSVKVYPTFEQAESEYKDAIEKFKESPDKPLGGDITMASKAKPYTIRVVGSDGETAVESDVQGYPLVAENYPEVSLFVHKGELGGWSVSEEESGLSIAKGETRKETVEKAKSVLTKVSPSKFKQAIEHGKGKRKGKRTRGGFLDNTPFGSEDLLEKSIDEIMDLAGGKRKKPLKVAGAKEPTLKDLRRVRAGEKVKTAGRDISTGLDKAFGVMSTRVKNISQTLFQDIRNKVIIPSKLLTGRRNEIAHPFIDGVNANMNDKDRRAFEIAQWQGESDTVNRLVTKYGLIDEYAEYRNMLDEVYHEGNSVGMDIDYHTAYFPSAIRDLDGLLKEIRRREDYAPLVEAMKNAEKDKGRPLSQDEKLRLINSLLRGYRVSGITLGKPGFAKERTLVRDDISLIRYYHGFEESTGRYIQAMTENIQERKFFGKTTKKLVDLRANISRTMTRVARLESGATKAKNQEAALAKAKARIAELQKELASLDDNLLTDSVANHTLSLVEKGELNYDQQSELQGILEGLFKVTTSNQLLHTITALEYAGSLAQVPAIITQYSEVVLSLLKSPSSTLPNFVKAHLGKSKITLRDLAVAHIGQEWVDADFDRTLTALMKPFEAADKIGKETYVNSVVDKYRKMAKDNPDKAREEISKYYPPEGVSAVMESLLSGEVDDNVKGFALNELSDVQPISKFEVPELYAKAGNLRVFYMYKTFVLKRLDILRNKGYNEIKAGVKSGNKKQIAKGIAKLLWLAFMFTLADASADAVKDMVRGKPLDTLDNYIVDNLLQMIMLNKYTISKSRKEGPGVFFKDNITLPVSNLNAAFKDVISLTDEDSEKGSETIRRIPWIGEMYYWYMGEGSRKIDEGVYD